MCLWSGDPSHGTKLLFGPLSTEYYSVLTCLDQHSILPYARLYGVNIKSMNAFGLAWGVEISALDSKSQLTPNAVVLVLIKPLAVNSTRRKYSIHTRLCSPSWMVFVQQM